MFKCACGTQQKKGVKMVKRVVQKRDVMYTNVHPETGETIVSRGFETVKEEKRGVCCAEKE